MCKIILPINPKYSQDILSKKKTFELRRKIPKRKVDKILIYETHPTMKVVGEIKIKNTIKKSLDDLWTLTKTTNSLTKKEFYKYFSGVEHGHAYEISEVRRFKRPMPLTKYSINFAPQGFIYLD